MYLHYILLAPWMKTRENFHNRSMYVRKGKHARCLKIVAETEDWGKGLWGKGRTIDEAISCIRYSLHDPVEYLRTNLKSCGHDGKSWFNKMHGPPEPYTNLFVRLLVFLAFQIFHASPATSFDVPRSWSSPMWPPQSRGLARTCGGRASDS